MGSVTQLTTSAADDSNTLVESHHHHTSCITEFHCTGFSKFHKVAVNPTELLMRELQSTAALQPTSPNSIIATATILETNARSASAVLSTLYKTRAKYCSSSAATSGKVSERRRVFIHCGVDVSSPRFRLEIQAVNEATFSCPDESGWMPCKLSIRPDLDLCSAKLTDIPMDDLVNRMRKKGFDTEVSYDAGRFVCNWVYYSSLKLAEDTTDCTALFVHVPDLKTVPLARQLAFLRTLLHEIANLPSYTKQSQSEKLSVEPLALAFRREVIH